MRHVVMLALIVGWVSQAQAGWSEVRRETDQFNDKTSYLVVGTGTVEGRLGTRRAAIIVSCFPVKDYPGKFSPDITLAADDFVPGSGRRSVEYRFNQEQAGRAAMFGRGQTLVTSWARPYTAVVLARRMMAGGSLLLRTQDLYGSVAVFTFDLSGADRPLQQWQSMCQPFFWGTDYKTGRGQWAMSEEEARHKYLQGEQ